MTINPLLRPGCTIRTIRQSKGMTIKQLSERSGVHHNQVAYIELKNTGGWAAIVALFQALDASLTIE